ncbi:hypothetical protein Tco_1038749 [Tanacetum coccineum]
MLNYFGKISFTRLTTKPTKSKKICTTPDSPKLSFTTSLLKTRHSPGETRSGCTPLRMTIKTLRFISAKEETQIYCAILPESLTSPEMKETKAYNTYFVLTEEPTRNSKRVKRPAKKSTKAQGRGVVIRETPEIPVSKKKEKVDVTRVTKTAPSAAKIKPSVTSEGTSGNDEDDSNNKKDTSGEDSDQENASDDDKTQSDKENESNSEHEKDENESDSISDQEENEKDDEDDEEEEEEEVVKTPSNDSDNEDQAKINNKAEVDTDKGFIQEEGTNAELTNIQQGNENPKITQVIEDSHVTLSTVPYKVFRVTALEKEVAELKMNDPLNTQVTALVDEYLDARLGVTREECMNRLSSSITTRITKQESSQPQSSYVAAATLTEFELKNILIDKMDKSESYLAAPEHRDCYEGLKKFYDLDKTFFSTYDKVKTNKDAESAKGPKSKESQSGLSKGDKSQSKYFGKSVQSEEPEFKVADSNMPQDQEENLGKDDEEPKEKVASKCDWFTKPTQSQEPTNPDWNADKTPQQGQNQSWLMTLASSADKPSKTFDKLMSTLIDFSAFIMNGLKINNLTQETLLGPAFMSHPAKAEMRGINKNGYQHNTWCLYREY